MIDIFEDIETAINVKPFYESVNSGANVPLSAEKKLKKSKDSYLAISSYY